MVMLATEHYRALSSITEYSNNITYIINIVTEYGNARCRALIIVSFINNKIIFN
jgi:hypothetical protein